MKKKVIFIPLLILLVLLVTLPAAAQSSEPTVAVLTAPGGPLTVGDPIELNIAVTHPAGTHVIMPELAGEWGSFLVNNQSAPVTQANADGTETTSQIIDARLFAPGNFSTPPVVISLTDGAGQVSEVIAEPLTVDISSVLLEGDSELRDIKPQVDIPYVNIMLWILPVMVAALIVGVVLLVVRRLRTRRALATLDNRLPHEVALDELDRIEGLKLPDAGLFKEHYTRVADTLRLYIERRFNVPMMERTTGEVHDALTQVDLPASLSGHILSILDVSDLVKFSKYLPEAGSAYGIITSVRQIVQATIPAVEEEDSRPPNSSAVVPLSTPMNSLNGKYQPTEVSA